MSRPRSPRVALVTGAAGQDGSYLVQLLLRDGLEVHGTTRPQGTGLRWRPRDGEGSLVIHELDLADTGACRELIVAVQPDELYNLGGQSSVASSFANPDEAWSTNAHAVEAMLEAVRLHSAHTRFYQASSSEMFGSAGGSDQTYAEESVLRPESPYAAAKAAAHLLCGAYRRAFDVRVACGIVFNHESSRRPATFLTRKVVNHVRAIREAPAASRRGAAPLSMGNLAARRDWGFAPDYVDGMRAIARQIDVRAAISGKPHDEDRGSSYRDYVLGTGVHHAVWELVDRAFTLAHLPLDWDRTGDPSTWSATFRDTSQLAVIVDAALLRPSDPGAITADPSRARAELGWAAQVGLDPFLTEMLGLTRLHDDG